MENTNLAISGISFLFLSLFMLFLLTVTLSYYEDEYAWDPEYKRKLILQKCYNNKNNIKANYPYRVRCRCYPNQLCRCKKNKKCPCKYILNYI